jgi:hypothetical protein
MHPGKYDYWSSAMIPEWKFPARAAAALLATTAFLPNGALAVSVEVAKKCNILVAKEFPPRQPGNPAAGSAKGSGKVQRDYFNKCVENNGNMDSTADKNTK